MFRETRKLERGLTKIEAIQILKTSSYGILSTISKNEYPHGVPVNYVFINNSIYFHCAMEGQKLDNITNNNKVSFCVVGQTYIIPDQFSTKYESVILFGRAFEIFDDEKNTALFELLKKYSPDYIEEGKEYIKDVITKSKIIKINIDHISGKARP